MCTNIIFCFPYFLVGGLVFHYKEKLVSLLQKCPWLSAVGVSAAVVVFPSWRFSRGRRLAISFGLCGLWYGMFVVVGLCKGKRVLTSLFFVVADLHYIDFPVTELFCIKEAKTMFIWFILGFMAHQYAVARKFLMEYHPVKLVVSSLLFFCVSPNVFTPYLKGLRRLLSIYCRLTVCLVGFLIRGNCCRTGRGSCPCFALLLPFEKI